MASSLADLKEQAMTAYRLHLRASVFTVRYQQGAARTTVITLRAPNAHSFAISAFLSKRFATAAGCSQAAGLGRLRRLVDAGVLERHQAIAGHMARFRFPRDVHERVGADVIARLRESGLLFSDEYLAQRAMEKAV